MGDEKRKTKDVRREMGDVRWETIKPDYSSKVEP